jgi:hypothetical protein
MTITNSSSLSISYCDTSRFSQRKPQATHITLGRFLWLCVSVETNFDREIYFRGEIYAAYRLREGQLAKSYYHVIALEISGTIESCASPIVHKSSTIPRPGFFNSPFFVLRQQILQRIKTPKLVEVIQSKLSQYSPDLAARLTDIFDCLYYE